MKKLSSFFLLFFIITALSCESFTLKAPVIIAPEDGSVVSTNPPDLIWHSVENADYYTVQIAYDGQFTDIVTSSCCNDTMYTHPTILASGTFHWRAMGQEGG